MKSIFIFLLFTLNVATAQNIGIGTTTPAEKLEVKSALRSTLKISSNSYVDTTELLLSNRTSSLLGTDFSIKNIREEGLHFSSLSDFAGNNSTNSFVIRPNGNVGVGMMPLYKFQVNGTSRFNGLTQMDGLNLFEFGAGVAGKELNAGIFRQNPIMAWVDCFQKLGDLGGSASGRNAERHPPRPICQTLPGK